MATLLSRFLLSAPVAVVTAIAGPAWAQGGGGSGNVDMSLPPVVHMQAVPPDRGTNDDTSGGAVFRDQPFQVNGTEVVCTGIDSDSRHDPRWSAYSLKMEFAGAGGQFLGEEHVVVSGNGMNVNVRCKGPWVLMKLGAGSYSIHADLSDGRSKAGSANVSGHGQTRVMIVFPNAGGETTGEQRHDE